MEPSREQYLKRTPILYDLAGLDDEAFNFIITKIHNVALARAGFRDQEGLKNLEQSTEFYLEQMR